MESVIRTVLIVLLFHFGCADVVRDYEIQKDVWYGSSNGNGSETHLSAMAKNVLVLMCGLCGIIKVSHVTVEVT